MRRKVKKKFETAPDHIHDSLLVAKFINYTMLDGKKWAARKIVYGAFDIIKEKEKTEALTVFESAIKNVGPNMEVRSRRVGGANYQVPREVRQERKQFLAMNWIIGAARAGKGSAMERRLADEIILASKGEGEAAKKRENIHKMAEANRAFAHFAW
jgi:small subunit ribosomal protein S7